MPYFGRRIVYIVGMAAMAFELILIGILNPWTHIKSVAWTQAILTLVWTVTFQLSAGQLGWALPAEIGSTRLRQKTVCLARNVSNILGVVCGTLNNYMVNPTAINAKGYTGFLWGGCAALVFVWSYFRLPETKVSDLVVPCFSSTSLMRHDRVARFTNWTFSSPNKCLPGSSPPQMLMLLTNMRRAGLQNNTRLLVSPPSDRL